MLKKLDRSMEGVITTWFDYNPTSGEITWSNRVTPEWYKHEAKYQTFLREKAGKPVVFSVDKNRGDLRVGAGGLRNVRAHTIAWVLTYGKLPTFYIDHIDGNPQNNKIENLRDVPQKINLRNRGMSSHNSSGVTGVSWHSQIKRWRAYIKIDGKFKSLGCYGTIQEASEARKKFIDNNPHLGYTARHGERQHKN